MGCRPWLRGKGRACTTAHQTSSATCHGSCASPWRTARAPTPTLARYVVSYMGAWSAGRHGNCCPSRFWGFMVLGPHQRGNQAALAACSAARAASQDRSAVHLAGCHGGFHCARQSRLWISFGSRWAECKHDARQTLLLSASWPASAAVQAASGEGSVVSQDSGLDEPLDLHLQRVESSHLIVFPDTAAGYVSQVPPCRLWLLADDARAAAASSGPACLGP